MKLYTINSPNITSSREAKKLVLTKSKDMSSPCYVDVVTANEIYHYYMEHSNIIGAKTLVIDRKYTNAPG